MMMIPRIKKLAEMQNSTILAFSEEKEVFSLYFGKEMRILFYLSMVSKFHRDHLIVEKNRYS